MKTNVQVDVPKIYREFTQQMAQQGTPLNREQRRALKRAERVKLSPRKNQANGLALLARRYSAEQPIDEKNRKEALADYFLAIDAFVHGRSTDDHADVLIYAVNIGYLLTEVSPDLGREHRSTLIKDAMMAMQRARDRREKYGKYGLDGEGLQALRLFSDLHEVQLEVATQAELQACIEEMHRRIDAGDFFFRFEVEDEAG